MLTQIIPTEIPEPMPATSHILNQPVEADLPTEPQPEPAFGSFDWVARAIGLGGDAA